jgi:hypothetical protein
MELIAVVALATVWGRALLTTGLQIRSILVPSLILAVISWVAIIQLIAFVLSSPLLMIGVLLVFLVVGVIIPGRQLARFLQPLLSHR